MEIQVKLNEGKNLFDVSQHFSKLIQNFEMFGN